MSHERRKVRFDDWDAVIADVKALQATGYEHASHGTLSLGQICAHLALFLGTAFDSSTQLLAWPMRMILRFLFLKRMLRHEPLSAKVNAPQPYAPPEKIGDQEGADQLFQAIERFRNHTGEYAPHMVFGKLTRDQWTHQQLWHCEHHLSFLVPREDDTQGE